MNKTGSLVITTPSDREIRITRAFDAPRHLVFDAYTKPELLKRWLGVFGPWTLPVCEVDLRVGGRYRFVWKNTNGSEMGMGGVYREIVKNERIVNTEKFDDAWYEGEAIATVVLIEQAGKTTLQTTIQYMSKAVRDGVLQSPMEQGLTASYDLLAEKLASAWG